MSKVRSLKRSEINAPIGLDLETIAEQWAEAKHSGRDVDAVEQAEAIIRQNGAKDTSELHIALCLSHLAKALNARNCNDDAKQLVMRARRLVAKELNQMDGFDP